MGKVGTGLGLSGERELRQRYSKMDFESCQLAIDAGVSKKFLNEVR